MICCGGVGTNLVFEVNDNMYPFYYLLVDVIDPQWFIFVQTVHKIQGEKQQHFAKTKEVACKDVEWCFGVPQMRFGNITNPYRQ